MTKYLTITAILLFAFSCKKDNVNSSVEIYGKWDVVSFHSAIDTNQYEKEDGFNPNIEFKSDGTVDIRLDVNSCFGNYKLSGISGINVEGVGCTEMCCDNEFSEKFVNLLPEVESFEKTGNNSIHLQIKDWGYIKLYRLN